MRTVIINLGQDDAAALREENAALTKRLNEALAGNELLTARAAELGHKLDVVTRECRRRDACENATGAAPAVLCSSCVSCLRAQLARSEEMRRTTLLANDGLAAALRAGPCCAGRVVGTGRQGDPIRTTHSDGCPWARS